MNPLLARDIMVTKLVTLPPDMDAFKAIELLLKHRISGAPVVDGNRKFLGVFSERCCMSVLLAAAYEQMPGSEILPFIDRDVLTTHEDADLLSIAQIFSSSHHRRLPVLRDDELVGQISRRDVLTAAHAMLRIDADHGKSLLYLSSLIERNEAPIA